MNFKFYVDVDQFLHKPSVLFEILLFKSFYHLFSLVMGFDTVLFLSFTINTQLSSAARHSLGHSKGAPLV